MADERDRLRREEIVNHASRLQALLEWLIDQKVDARLAPRLDREAVAQETLRKALEAIDKGAEPIKDLQRWLNRILVNTLTDEIRRATGRLGLNPVLEAASSQSVARLEEVLIADQTSPSQRAIRNEDERRLSEAMGRLTEDERRVVELCWLREPPLSHAAAAEEMGRTIPSVRGLLARAMKKLHAILKT
jgi:RNA polymerase sigma factor (sigma-70 family)